jgi:hypothetical protein
LRVLRAPVAAAVAARCFDYGERRPDCHRLRN